MNRKVCHLTSVHKRYDTRIFHKQCTGLASADFDVTLICVDDQADEIKKGVKIISILPTTANKFIRIIKRPKKVYKAALSIDAEIYQLHDPELIPIGLKLIKKGKIVIFDSHEDLPSQILEKKWIPKILRKVMSKLAEQYLKKTLCKFNAVLTVTPHIVEILEKISDNVNLITNYPIVDNDQKAFSMIDYKSRLNTICYSGTVYRISQQENILEAIDRIENVRYTIVGMIDNKYKSELSKFPAWEKTSFIERVPKEKLLEIYGEVTIGVVIFNYSKSVGFKKGTLGNNKIFEYMLAGLPIICTDFVLWKEIIHKYKCGIYVNPNDIEEISNAVNYLINHKEEAYRMGQNGIQAVLEEFNWKSQEKSLLKIYRSLLN
jgi:glycosyltransferase involved in cell wall biosynthesis